MNLAGCPDDDALVAFAAGLATDAEQARIEFHLDACSLCRQLIAAGASTSDQGRFDPGASAAIRGGLVGRYQIGARIGAGAMGTVHRAWDPALDRHVAIKLVHARWAQNPEARARLAREAKALAQLSHPNVLPIYDVGTLGTNLFLAIEWVDGCTLETWCEGRDEDEVLSCYLAAGRGLEAAHHAELIHRDFKPSNVLIGRDDRPMVADFGLVAAFDERRNTSNDDGPLDVDDRLTRDGSIVGTPRFMAPEQLRGQGALKASDQFSFCVALFGALYGTMPFEGTCERTLRASIERGPCPPSGRANPRVLAALVRGLSARPSERYPSMAALLCALESASRPESRWRAGVAAVAVTLLCGGAVAAVAGVGTDPCQGPEASVLRGRSLDDALGPHAKEPVAEEVSSFVQTWSDVYEPACRQVQRSQDPGPRTFHCLDVVRLALDQSLAELRASTSSESIVGLPASPARCLSADAEPTEGTWSAVTSYRIADARRTLKQVNELYADGKLETAEEKLDAAWSDLHSQPSPSIRVQAGLLRGTMLLARARDQEAVAVLEAGFDEASRYDLHTLGLRIATALMVAHGQRLNDVKAAKRWDATANALAAQTRSQFALAKYWNSRAGLLLLQRKMDDALKAAETGLQFATASDNGAQTISSLEHRIAVISLHQLDYKKARAYYERLLRRYTESHGAGHPNLAGPLSGLAQVSLAERDFEEAQVLIEEARALLVDAFGPQSPRLLRIVGLRARLESLRGNTTAALELHHEMLAFADRRDPSERVVRPILRDMSMTLWRAGDWAGALRLRERELVLSEGLDGTDSYQASLSRTNLAWTQLALGQHGEAEAGFRRALRDLEGTLGPDASHWAYPLSGLGSALVAQGELSRAVPLLEQALAEMPEDGIDWALAAAALARARWAPGTAHDPNRALLLANKAERILTESPAHRREHEDVSNWLATL